LTASATGTGLALKPTARRERKEKKGKEEKSLCEGLSGGKKKKEKKRFNLYCFTEVGKKEGLI